MKRFYGGLLAALLSGVVTLMLLVSCAPVHDLMARYAPPIKTSEAVLLWAKSDDAWAQYLMSALTASGVSGFEKNPLASLGWLQKAAENGLDLAQMEIGHRYLIGHGVANSQSDAINWFTKAASQGFTPAQYQLTLLYADDNSGVFDNKKAHFWCELAYRFTISDEAVRKDKAFYQKLAAMAADDPKDQAILHLARTLQETRAKMSLTVNPGTFSHLPCDGLDSASPVRVPRLQSPLK